MNEKEIAEALGKMAEADAPLHASVVRSALMQAHAPKGFAPLRALITHFVMNKYTTPGLVLGAVMLAFVFNFTAIDPATAQAQEMAERAFARAVKLSPEMRAKIEEKMKADLMQTLEEAKAAPDLRILTKEEFEKESPFTISTTSPAGFGKGVMVGMGEKPLHTVTFERKVDGPVGGAHGASIMFAAGGDVLKGDLPEPPQPVKFLSYTDPKGNKTVLGLDEHDTPVFKFSTIRAENIQHLKDGSIGIPAERVMMLKELHAEE